MLQINDKRLWTDLIELGRIGLQDSGGVTRTALSYADQLARQWLLKKMKAAGLMVKVDGAMNVVGTLKADQPLTDKKACMGSHLDTVPNGGLFDGALGVVAALECTRTLKEHQIVLPWDLEVISFCDEEGAHNAGTVGSRAMMGLLQEREIYRSKVKGGSTFADNLKRWGRDPGRIIEAKRNPEDFCFFLELHIEQGPRLESENISIGVVSAIAGIYRYLVTVTGEAAHAGTTPMKLRKDALVEASPIFSLLPQWVQKRNPEMMGTIGNVSIEPGASNVVPGECRFVVELRSQNIGDLKFVRDQLKSYTAEMANWQVETIYEKDGVQLSKHLMNSIVYAVKKESLNWMSIPSGAGHDAQSFAPFVPTGMIFVPCRNGVSHHPAEFITQTDASNGCQVLLKTIQKLADDKTVI